MTDIDPNQLADPANWDNEAILGLIIELREEGREEQHWDEWSSLLAAYIDEELSGGAPAAKYPEMHQHLQSCPLCSEAYPELLDLGRADLGGQVIDSADVGGVIDLRSVGLGVLDLEDRRWLFEDEIGEREL
ncbi:MAG: hypothetical protein ACE5JU_15630 [Candidatus Binatia bacterium]